MINVLALAEDEIHKIGKQSWHGDKLAPAKSLILQTRKQVWVSKLVISVFFFTFISFHSITQQCWGLPVNIYLSDLKHRYALKLQLQRSC